MITCAKCSLTCSQGGSKVVPGGILDMGLSLTSGVSVPPTGQHCCASGDFIYDCAVNSKSARGFKRRVGELMEGKTIKDIIYPGSISAAESP